MLDINRKQTVTLDWSYPQEIENFKFSHYEDMMGIYMITRKFGNNKEM